VSAGLFVVGAAGIVVVDLTMMAVVVAAVGGTVVVVGCVVLVVDSTIVFVSSADDVGPTTAVNHAFSIYLDACNYIRGHRHDMCM